MNSSLILFDEPALEFRYGQKAIDPRDGLSLFGPYDAELSSRPTSLSYMVIGTNVGVSNFQNWVKLMNEPSIKAPKNRTKLWPPFPGFEAAFNIPWPSRPITTHVIDSNELLKSSILRDQYARAYQLVNYYLEGIEKTEKFDEKIGVIVCVVPDDVWNNCRPLSHIVNGTGPKLSYKELNRRRTGQTGLFDVDPEKYQLSTDFRRQLKARSMKFGIPIQIIRESTLRLSDENTFGSRGLTPLSDRMWNLSTTLYYKCGGKPWRLLTAREGVCYIGIAFKRTGDDNTACCAAQMFLNTGDGIVFLGEFGPWYSLKNNQYHLTRQAAHDLLDGILKTYKELEGKELSEIFLHSRSSFNHDEIEGFQSACPLGAKIVGVRVQTNRNGLRVYREGSMPVVRGTFWKISNRSGVLWANGFKPRLATYDGWEVPAPLDISIQYGDAPIERVAQDIFGLTKLNYNACKLGDSSPVTVEFSDAVGEILIANPTIKERKPQFRFYI